MTDYIEENIDFIEEEKTKEQESNSLYEDSVYSYSNTIKKEFDNTFYTEYKKFTKEDYQTLNENLLLYKSGNREAAQYIINVFHRFIKEYAEFICYGDYGEMAGKEVKYRRPSDKSLTRFISLFIAKKDRDDITNALEKNTLFVNSCVKIKKLFSKFDYWDIYNELACTLLNMANKYKITKEGDMYHKENGTFHMYVNRCFHFDSYNSLTKLINDPLARTELWYLDNVCSNHDFYDLLKDTETDKSINKIITKAVRQKRLDDCTDSLILKEDGVDPYEMESLNFNWTNGNTCSDIFKCLTSYERELIVMSFVQNKTDSEIASIYGCHRITVVKHKKIAVNKIKKYTIKNKNNLEEDFT